MNRSDFEFLRRLAGMQYALANTACSPIKVFRMSEGAFENLPFPGMSYYSCRGRTAKEVVARRLASSPEIAVHLRVHQQCLDAFAEIDRALLEDDRDSLGKSCLELYRQMRVYAELVRVHRTRADWFMNFPKCVLGYRLSAEGYSQDLDFNQPQSYGGLLDETDALHQSYLDFSSFDGLLPRLDSTAKNSAGFFVPRFKDELRKLVSHLARLGYEA